MFRSISFLCRTGGWVEKLNDDFGLKSKAELDTFIQENPESWIGFSFDMLCSGSEAPMVGVHHVLPDRAYEHAMSVDKCRTARRFAAQNFTPMETAKHIDEALGKAQRTYADQRRLLKADLGAKRNARQKRPKGVRRKHKVMVAGFPCQPHSTLSQNRFSEKGGFRGGSAADVYWSVSSWIDIEEPDVFLLENVTGIGLRSDKHENTGLQIVDNDLRKKTKYLVKRFRGRAAGPRRRVRYWWLGAKKARVTSAKFATACAMAEKAEATRTDDSLDTYILPSDDASVTKMLEDYKPVHERYILLNRRMEVTTQEKHARLRSLLDIPGFNTPEGRPFSATFSVAVKHAMCAREGDLADVWFLTQKLSPEQFKAARLRIKAARAAGWKELALLPPWIYDPGKKFYIELSWSLERWPFFLEPQCFHRSTKTFDTAVKRPYCATEGFGVMGWGSFIENLDFTQCSEAQLMGLLGESMEVPSVTRYLAAALPLLEPRMLKCTSQGSPTSSSASAVSCGA